jgi:hypothetical protein
VHRQRREQPLFLLVLGHFGAAVPHFSAGHVQASSVYWQFMGMPGSGHRDDKIGSSRSGACNCSF